MEWHVSDAQSLGLIDNEIGDHGFSAAEYEIVRRVIYATADFEYKSLISFSDQALQAGAANPDSRHAVFSFLAGFWRQDYSNTIQKCDRPTLIVMGEQASSISQAGKEEKPEERLAQYLANFPNAEGLLMPGRNVLPYESTAEFVSAVAEFVNGSLQPQISADEHR